MALNIGELVGYLGLESDKFDQGLAGSLDKLKATGGKITKLAAGIGAGAAVALGAALVGAMGQQDIGAKVAAQLGGGSEQAAEYGKLAGTIYARNFGESLDQVGEALKSVQQANLLPAGAGADALQGVTEKALTFTNVFGKDMPAVINAVQQMLRTGMAKSADEAFDVLTRGEQQGIDKADDLLDTFNEYPTQFRKLGLDSQTAMGLLSQGLKAGARDSDIVADALKEFSIRAVDGSTTTAAGFKLLGLNGQKMAEQISRGGKSASDGLQTTLDKLRAIKDPVTRSAAAVDLFGTQAEDMGQALYSLDPSKAVDTLGQVKGATDKAGKTMSNTASGNIESFKRQAQVTFVDLLGNKVLPPVMQLTGWLKDHLGPAVTDVTKWMGKHKDIVEPLAAILGTLVGVVLAVSAALKAWEIIQAILNVELWANPVGLIVLAIIALIAVVVLIATKTTWFQSIWHAVWGGIKGAAEAVGHWFASTLPGYFVTAYNWIKSKAGDAKDWVVARFNDLIGFFKGIPKKLRSAASGMWDGIKDAFKSAINWLIGKWNGLHLSIPSIDTHIPGIGKVGGFTLRAAQIPYLARGGIVPATPGGRLVGVGEAGEDEAVIPLSKLAGLLGAGAGGTFRIESTGSTGDRILETLLALLRDHIRLRYRGSAQLALGG